MGSEMCIRDRLKIRHYEKKFLKILLAINHMHKSNIVHGDIKLSNVVIGKAGNLQVIDFGYSTIFKDLPELITSYSGTPVYLAPEIVNRKPFDGISY